jgi:hypothetical protein
MRHALPLILAAACLVSCDKARELVGKAGSAAKGQIARSLQETSEEAADPALLALVDETAEGVVFRKDLPFPTALKVRETDAIEFRNVRAFASSELGSQSATLRNTNLRTTVYQLSSSQLRLTLETLQTSEPPAGDSPEAQPVTTVDPLQGGVIDFRFSNDQWSAVGTTDFRKAVWQRDLLPHLPTLLGNAGVRPRPLWFAKKRILPGEVVAIGDSLMPMLFDGGATGSLELTFEGSGPVHGHPCGIFAIKGGFSRKNAPEPDGTLADEEVTIESGKIWLSLLHPVVLRMDLETIQTYKSAKGGGPGRHIQGSIRITTTREWMPAGEDTATARD